MTGAVPPDAAAAAARQQRFINGFISSVPHVALLGIRYAASGADWAELVMAPAPQQVADPDYGILASGAVFTLLDSAAGMAIILKQGELLPHATLDMRIDYLRGPAPGATIIARAECYRLTRQIAFVRGIAHDGASGETDDPIAHMTGTFMFTAAAPAA